MSDFFAALKADLTDRRLRPIVAVAVIALLGAAAYVALSGGSSSSTPQPVAALPGASAPSGIAATSTTPNTAVAETTEGQAAQHHGTAHDPFSALPQAKVVVKTTTTSSSSGSSGSTASNTSSSSSEPSKSSGSETTTPATPAAPAKPKVVYHVAVLFGLTPAEPPAPSVALVPYENLKLLAPLPSAKSPLIVFRGVTAGGKSATFTIVSEAILHGPGACRPSTSQCQAIDLKPGQTEQFEYLGSEGEVTSYELTVTSIVSGKASTAALKNLLGGTSNAGRELLRSAGLLEIPGLRASSQAGVLVFAGHSAFAARAHAARRSHAGR